MQITARFATLLFASSVTAQAAMSLGTDGTSIESIPEVIVTATKYGATEEQKTPLAMTVFSADRLNASLVTNIKDLVSLAPNVSVAQANANAEIYIRGIGSNNVFNGSDPDVTTQVDGIYIARSFAQFADFLDVQRIEVLRGPQGTLYGRNAVGGTINIISRQPTDDFEARAQLTVGDFGLVQPQVSVSGPLVPGKLDASLSANYIRHNDFIGNVDPGHQGVGDANRGGVRGQLRFIPTDNIEATTRADWSSADERFDSYDHLLARVAVAPLASSIVGDYTKTAIDAPQSEHTDISGISETIDAKISDAVSLKSITAYRLSRYTLSNDSDGTELTINTALQSDTSRQFSQEFNSTAKLDRFTGVVGVFYFQEHETSTIAGVVPPSVNTPAARSFINEVQPNSHTQSVAGFAQGTYHLIDGLSVTAGIRYTADNKKLDQNYTRTSLNPATLGASFRGFPFAADFNRNFDAATPKFGIDWQATSVVLLYASATKGFKSGGTNFAASSPVNASFGPEHIWSYESGIKSDWLDHRLRVNISGFYYDYTGLQVQSLIAPGVVAIGNAASATVKGAEFEVTAKPIPALLLNANYSLLHSRYDRFTNASVPGLLIPYVKGSPSYSAATNTYDATGNSLNSAPKSSFSGSAEYDVTLAGGGTVFVRGDYYWQDRVYYDPSNASILSQKPYSLVNLGIGLNSADKLWRVELIAKNIADTHYLITVAANGLAPAGLAGAPRTIACQVSRNW